MRDRKRDDFNSGLAALALVFGLAFAGVAWFHMQWWWLVLPVAIMVIGIVYTMLEDMRRR